MFWFFGAVAIVVGDNKCVAFDVGYIIYKIDVVIRVLGMKMEMTMTAVKMA